MDNWKQTVESFALELITRILLTSAKQGEKKEELGTWPGSKQNFLHISEKR